MSPGRHIFKAGRSYTGPSARHTFHPSEASVAMSDTSDCGCPPPKELVLCFDGTGNTFRADGAESNILKIFRMLDRKKENRCKFEPWWASVL